MGKSFKKKAITTGNRRITQLQKKGGKIMEDKNRRCKHCNSKRLKAITGLTIGDPLKEEYTTWIISECEECKFTTLLKTEIGKKFTHGLTDQCQGSC